MRSRARLLSRLRRSRSSPRSKGPPARKEDALRDLMSFLGFDSLCCAQTNLKGARLLRAHVRPRRPGNTQRR